jgi:hypothetical protein
MNNFELQMTIWKLINPVPANCDSRSAAQWEKGFQLAVSGSKQPFALVSVTDYLVVSIRECL